ncbi:MAG: ABC transporter permease [Chlorobiaceae bacterium]|nr:ABC transporter permease [Chlorobiaceae bacterium]
MLKFLLEKEFKQFFRNRFLPRLVVIFPFVALLIFPLVANFEIKNINLSIIDNDKSSYSQSLIQKIQSSGYFRITDVSETYDGALKNIEINEADIIIEIPNNFEKDLVNEKFARVMISANAVSGVKAGLGGSYLANILNDYSSVVREKWIDQSKNKISIPHLEIVPQFRFNPTLEYKIFMIPALMVMVLSMICGFLPALNIVGEKENGTIEQMNVTPVKKFTLILSKLIPYWIIGFVVLTICFGVARVVYGLIPVGSILTIYLCASVFVLAYSGFGLVISNYAKTVQQAMFMMFFFVMTFVFMSGLYTPVANMPEWAQLLSNYSPLKYIIQVLRLVYLKGSGITDLLIPFLALCGFALFFNSWAIYSYRKNS